MPNTIFTELVPKVAGFWLRGLGPAALAINVQHFIFFSSAHTNPLEGQESVKNVCLYHFSRLRWGTVLT